MTMTVKSDLAKLIGFPTISNTPVVELAAFLGHRLEDLGFRVERFDHPTWDGKCNLVASIGPTGTNGLTMSGHMDVVPTENQPWDTDPFVLTQSSDLLYGRGTADMKGFIAATLQALKGIQASEYQRELVLVWTHDEEVGCLGSAQLVSDLKRDGRHIPKACLIGEPTDFKILRMHPGHVKLSIDVQGSAAHSSRPDLGDNAIETAAHIIGKLQNFGQQLSQEHYDISELERPWTVLNIGMITGGSAVNIVPDQCQIQLGYRPPPGADALEVFHRIEKLIEDSEFASKARVQLNQVTPSMYTPPNTELEGLLYAHASSTTCGAAGFATDGGNLAKLGIESLIFGPGSIDVAHKANEYISSQALHQAVDIIESLVRTRCVLPL
jgi:acetylornithine deacetylase